MPTEDRRYRGPTAHASARAISATDASKTTRRMSVALHGERRRLRDDGTRPAAEHAPLAQGLDRGEEQRDEEDSNGRRDQHAEEHTRAHRVAAGRPGPARREQRRYT